MRSAQSSSRPTAKRDLLASSSGSKVLSARRSPAKSPSPTLLVDSGQLTARQTRQPSPPSVTRDHQQRDADGADRRSMRRRVIADDPDWTLATVPDLVELTVRHIVDNFASQYS